MFNALATFPTKASAVAWLEDERELIELDRRQPGTWTPPAERAAKRQAEKLTLRAYSTARLKNKTKLARRTRYLYQSQPNNLILPSLGDLGLAEVTPEHVRSWFAGLGTDHESRNAQAYGVLNGIFNTALSDDLIDKNPCRIRGAGSVTHAKRSVVLLDAGQLGRSPAPSLATATGSPCASSCVTWETGTAKNCDWPHCTLTPRSTRSSGRRCPRSNGAGAPSRRWPHRSGRAMRSGTMTSWLPSASLTAGDLAACSSRWWPAAPRHRTRGRLAPWSRARAAQFACPRSADETCQHGGSNLALSDCDTFEGGCKTDRAQSMAMDD